MPPPPQVPFSRPLWPYPVLQIRIDDLAHPGTNVFLQSVDPHTVLKEAVDASFKWLYVRETVPEYVRTIRLILRPMPGVAHTTGSRHEKEIHLSLDHIVNSIARAKSEICGVLVHEVVHCFQYDALGTCPGGLIEGIADYVRLRAGYSPPHWKPGDAKSWDAGYEKTGYFLKWIEDRYGDGTVRELNGTMEVTRYDSKIFKDITGRPVHKLWKLYCETLEGNQS